MNAFKKDLVPRTVYHAHYSYETPIGSETLLTDRGPDGSPPTVHPRRRRIRSPGVVQTTTKTALRCREVDAARTPPVGVVVTKSAAVVDRNRGRQTRDTAPTSGRPGWRKGARRLVARPQLTRPAKTSRPCDSTRPRTVVTRSKIAFRYDGQAFFSYLFLPIFRRTRLRQGDRDKFFLICRQRRRKF